MGIANGFGIAGGSTFRSAVSDTLETKNRTAIFAQFLRWRTLVN